MARVLFEVSKSLVFLAQQCPVLLKFLQSVVFSKKLNNDPNFFEVSTVLFSKNAQHRVLF
jgi:hypothetical protein